MKLKVSKLNMEVSSTRYTPKGDKLEPEQQLTRQVFEDVAPVTGTQTGPLGGMRGQIVVVQDAKKVAFRMRGLCGLCKHFDHAAAQKALRASDHPLAPMEARAAVNQVRAALLESGNARLVEMSETKDGEFDPEHAMSLCGFCRPISEIQGEDLLVHPESSCPEMVKDKNDNIVAIVTEQKPDGLFVARSNDAAKEGTASYDEIMNKAAGKT